MINCKQNESQFYEMNVGCVIEKTAEGNRDIYDKGINIKVCSMGYSFENFITCERNMIAFNAAKAVASSTKMYNPLYIYGNHGSGKTHLLKSIEKHIVMNCPDMEVLYVTAEKFCNDVLEAIRSGFICDIRELYRSPNVLLIDDINYLIGKEMTLKEIMYTIDSLLVEGSQVVISADKPPKELEVEEQMRSRIGMGLIAELKAPDFSLKKNLIRMKVGERGVLIQDDVADYIAENIGSNINDIEGAITSIVAYSELTRPIINLETAKTILKDVISANK